MDNLGITAQAPRSTPEQNVTCRTEQKPGKGTEQG
jgi:hypothetical protein